MPDDLEKSRFLRCEEYGKVAEGISMGGYGSGRNKTHLLTSECIPIDMSLLSRHRLLSGHRLRTGCRVVYTMPSSPAKEKSETVETVENELTILIKRYASGRSGKYAVRGCAGHITLHYWVQGEGGERITREMDIPLAVTHPHLGGVRWWFLAPCCGSRMRILYLPTYLPAFGEVRHIVPACRNCLGLHYPSQQESPVERHKTYERHLLANYGYTWAKLEYEALEEYYFKLTPEWELIKVQSVLRRQLELIKHRIAAQRVLFRTDMHHLRSLKSEEDRQVYLDRLAKTHGSNYAQELAHVLRISFQIERDAYDLPLDEFVAAYMQEATASPDDEAPPGTTEHNIESLQALIESKRAVEEDLKALQTFLKAA